jgi:hypothetical protein
LADSVELLALKLNGGARAIKFTETETPQTLLQVSKIV